MILTVGMQGLKFREDVDQVVRVVKKFIQSIEDELFENFGGDGFGGAGLFIFGSGADVLTVVVTIGLFGGLPIEGAAAAGAFSDG